MFDFIFSTFWGDSASYLSSIQTIVPESLTTAIAVMLRNHVSPVSILNTQIFLAFITTLGLSYYVGIKTFKSKIPAAFIALIITFAPLRLRYSMEWAVISFWGYYILFFYTVFNYIKSPNKWYLLFAGISFGLGFTEQPYIGVILTFMTSTTLLIYFLIKRKLTYIKPILILSLTLIIFGIPGIYNITKDRYINEIYDNVNFYSGSRPESDRWAYSARPWNYLIPDINNPFLGDYAVKANYWIWNQPPHYITEPFFPKEHTLYLGLTVIALAGLTLYLTYLKRIEYFNRYRSQTLFLLILTVSAFIFSMPPYITINGLYIYFPSSIIYNYIPLFRAYARFGAIVFIGTAMIATTTIAYITQVKISKLTKILLLLSVTFLLLIEFATPYFSNKISSDPTPPYIWLAEQPGNFSYLEIPQRIDYTDSLYKTHHKKKILNPYLATPENIKEIEDSIIHDIGDSKKLLCEEFTKNLNGKYIMYHNKEVYKDQLVEEFKKTNTITTGLKIALEESWGEPIWGNHVPKSETDLEKDAFQRNLLNKLENDPRLVKIREFPRTSGQIYNANDLDGVTIFEINPNYCN